MSILRFFRENFPLLLFGLLLSFFSGFGQTYFFSLYLPGFQESFGLTSGTFGTFYSAVTLCSALLLPFTGALIDRVNLKYYALTAIVVMALAAATISLSAGLIALFLGILGVRHTGQALMGHISQTTMARYYDHARGKALSIASLGHPFSEAILPVSFALLIAAVGWRTSWLLVSAFVLIAAFLLVPLLLKSADRRGLMTISLRDEVANPEVATETSIRSWTRAEMLKDPRFYFVIPAGLASPILMTAFFLYQIPLAESKGWSIEWLAACFVAFAASKSIISLLSGPVIDSLTARRVYPFMLLPMILGFIVLLLGSHPITALFYMLLIGTTEGLSANTKTAMFAELYGVKYLGAIRSTLVSMMVFSTALSPILFGNLLDANINFDHLIMGALALLILSMLLSIRIYPWVSLKTK
ncbi:MAG: MFS transporter [Balneolales bacterium]|nr:MFS transporter [Balneolales bacterium]